MYLIQVTIIHNIVESIFIKYCWNKPPIIRPFYDAHYNITDVSVTRLSKTMNHPSISSRFPLISLIPALIFLISQRVIGESANSYMSTYVSPSTKILKTYCVDNLSSLVNRFIW